MDGIVNIDKPEGTTSRQIVSRIKKLSSAKKAGHGGTLDPAASGVLTVLLGEACKLSRFFLNTDKSYEAKIKLGYFSDTLDREGNIVKKEDFKFTDSEAKKAVNSFKGIYRHRVPEYSAKKYKGETFYKIKRDGRKPPERYQETKIYDIKFIDRDSQSLSIEVACSSGTYIRSLGLDIAKKLGTEGYLMSLRRIRSGGMDINESVKPESWQKGFIDISTAAKKFNYAVINNKSSKKVLNGVEFKESDILKSMGDIGKGLFTVFSKNGDLLAISELKDGRFSLRRVFNL